jgi:hypothetical protein
MPGEDEDIVEALLRGLKQRSETAQDSELKQVFQEFTAELRKFNEGAAGDRASEEQLAEHEELSRRYPAMKTKPPRPRRRAS